GQGRFDLECQQQLVKFTGVGFFRGKTKVARQLHGDGTGTLGFGPGNHVGEGRTGNPAQIDPTVLIKTVILGGENGGYHDIGEFIKGDDIAALFDEFADEDLVSGVNTQWDPWPIISHGTELGQIGPS